MITAARLSTALFFFCCDHRDILRAEKMIVEARSSLW
jgi:hypothetical protein